jgi:hypothetical protein
MSRIAALLTCLALTGCVAAAAPKPVGLGTDFTLAPGESAPIEGASLSVRFVAVTEDSRCPSDTTCVWAGEVEVKLEILERSKPARQLQLKSGETADLTGFRLTLLSVDPPPVSTARISAQAYRATLRAERAH